MFSAVSRSDIIVVVVDQAFLRDCRSSDSVNLAWRYTAVTDEPTATTSKSANTAPVNAAVTGLRRVIVNSAKPATQAART